MLTFVHRTRVFAVLFCVLSCLSVLPSLAHAEGVVSEIPTLLATTSEAVETAVTPTDTDPLEALLNLYPTEGVPGGGAVIGDFVVGPGKVDLTIKPGESKTVEMTVTNRTGERRKFNLTAEDAQGSQDTETAVVLLGDDIGPYSMKDFVSVPHTSFVLDHNQRARVPVTISLPVNADPGGLYGSVLVNTVAVDATPGDTGGTVPQSAIVARIGTLFFVTIPGAIEKDGSLKAFGTAPEQTFFQSGPVHFGILFENKGSIHLAPYGELRIKNMFNQEVGFQKLDPWFVLPQSLRLREITWDRDFLFGRYVATVSINRSYDDVIDEMSYAFWVLPWKPLVGVFVLLFLVFFTFRAFFRRFEFKRK